MMLLWFPSSYLGLRLFGFTLNRDSALKIEGVELKVRRHFGGGRISRRSCILGNVASSIFEARLILGSESKDISGYVSSISPFFFFFLDPSAHPALWKCDTSLLERQFKQQSHWSRCNTHSPHSTQWSSREASAVRWQPPKPSEASAFGRSLTGSPRPRSASCLTTSLLTTRREEMSSKTQRNRREENHE